jgi:hypothetical protein
MGERIAQLYGKILLAGVGDPQIVIRSRFDSCRFFPGPESRGPPEMRLWRPPHSHGFGRASQFHIDTRLRREGAPDHEPQAGVVSGNSNESLASLCNAALS